MNSYRIALNESTRMTFEHYAGEVLRPYLDEKLGPNARIWFHVDAHSKMCDLEKNAYGGAAFYRGAMSMLTFIRNAVVIATAFWHQRQRFIRNMPNTDRSSMAGDASSDGEGT
jgi:hypothetical protein